MKSKYCLIVDDSKSARFTLKRLVEKMGHKVDCVESGESALRFLSSATPDIIFMDHLMPGKDGFTTSIEIKHSDHWAHIPIVMCTSKEGDEFIKEAQQIGISGVLPKPASLNQIAQILEQLEREEIRHKETPKPAEEKPKRPKRTAPPQTQKQPQPQTKSTPTPQPTVQLANQANMENTINRIATGIAKKVAKEMVDERWSELRPILYEDAAQLSQRLISESLEDVKKNVIRQTTKESETLIAEMVKPLVRDLTESIVTQKIQILETKFNKELKHFKIDIQQAFPDPDSLHEALIEEAKHAAEFTATHKSFETAKQISKETTRKEVSGLFSNTYLPLIEEHIHDIMATKKRKFTQLQLLSTTAVVISLFAVVLTLLKS